MSMAVNPQQELVWQGRTHLGDEPGIYGDAHYSGLCAELPITVFRLDPANPEDIPFKLVLETENLETFNPFPGHAITITVYEPDPTKPNHSIEIILATDRFTSADNNRKEVTINVGNGPGPFRISVRLRIDTTVDPGFYDDFVWLRLSLLSEGFAYFASFGFDA
jgi:hypothetical protein